MKSIFVAKLDFGVTEEELRSKFEQFGSVAKAHIATDKETGKPRGFAFVEMPNDEEADAAISGLDGFLFNGRACVVKEADDRGGNKSSRPQNQNRNFDRNRSNNQPRTEFKPRTQTEEERPPVSPSFSPDDSFSNEAKSQSRKKSAPKDKPKTDNDSLKKPKMDAYKKSGKSSFYNEDDEELDEDFDLFGREEDEDLDEDYSKYLVNSDDDEDYDDEDYDDEDLDEYDDDYDDEY